ncbi:MAG: hypothetical protein D6785_05370 [Planctomycetota bacterium]|nr:MAG: hypothetical protein D6785_05370 [Planctomycetota bacterium]
MDEKVLMLAVAMGYGMIEVLKALIMLLKNKIQERNGTAREKHDSRIIRIEEAINQLLDSHSIRDQNGVPLWYIPREWGKMLEKIVKLQEELIRHQSKILDILCEQNKPKKRGRPSKNSK